MSASSGMGSRISVLLNEGGMSTLGHVSVVEPPLLWRTPANICHPDKVNERPVERVVIGHHLTFYFRAREAAALCEFGGWVI